MLWTRAITILNNDLQVKLLCIFNVWALLVDMDCGNPISALYINRNRGAHNVIITFSKVMQCSLQLCWVQCLFEGNYTIVYAVLISSCRNCMQIVYHSHHLSEFICKYGLACGDFIFHYLCISVKWFCTTIFTQRTGNSVHLINLRIFSV